METAHFVRAISTEDVRIVKEIHFNYKFGSSVSTAKVVYLIVNSYFHKYYNSLMSLSISSSSHLKSLVLR